MKGFFKRPFFIKLFNWEYWPFGVVQLPLIFMWIAYSIREKSPFYFSASNPGIVSGGMMGESKYEVLKMVPSDVTPTTLLVKLPATAEDIEKQMKEAGLRFPVIFKPDLGERGWMVRRINTLEEAAVYLREIKIDFIVQEFVDLPLEFGVFYVRFPSAAQGTVNSITMKEFLSVTGDGIQTLQELILQKDRALLQWEVLKEKYKTRLQEIVPAGERMELISIGNHCLGTKFLNANHLINERLIASFDKISQQVKGFYFGRYDLRCASVEDLEEGKVKIVELNGCGAEPAHIYQPGTSLWGAMKVLIVHWQNMYKISRENFDRGIPYVSFGEGRKIYKRFKSLKS